MPKITFIGAGSTIFAKRLLVDILTFPELTDATIFLHDIDEKRLETSTLVAHKVVQACNAAATIHSSTNRREALDGANYVITMIQVAGYKPGTVIDFEIPKKYGLYQTIADTLGIGGIMRGLRTIPVLLDICRDMEELCPDALLLQYVNPMVMNCWAINIATSIKTVGLCHSVPHTAQYLATDLKIPYEEMNYLVAGINHVAFFLKLEHQGKDLYPQLRAFAKNEDAPIRRRGMVDAVRYEVFQRLGYFVTESSEHFAEYVPWFIKRGRPDLLTKFNIPLDEYINRCERQISEWDALREKLLTEETTLDMQRSAEYGSLIIHSMETGQPRTIYGNVPNANLITNLPSEVPVELPCLVDKNGIQPTHIGELPPQLAALMQTNINVHRLTVEAALTQKREHIYHAAMLDPHTAAELDLVQIHSMVDELIEAHGCWLPTYQ
ncbi:alpha-glucosidase/alpha-galactosidase [Candidatus Leptofilum sp.]|uniref:alpha-glucosidase/alpha-galactosidase n=1 Tax=Candidatus Leptofilum sp. TaxID=3241576 RepID=UPI003B5AE3CE